MTTITLEQHWYASAPIGLRSARGFQTVAKSAKLGDESLLELHCAYRRPPGYAEDCLPVNWGWFILDDGRACIHRIGYSGTDEVGRPGNFLAHNLVVHLEALKAIDYDLPGLICWVREASPIRYALEGGGTDGFARSHDDIYANLGKNSSQLGSAPFLEVPVDEVRARQESLDPRFARTIDNTAHHALSRKEMAALWQAYMCSPEHRKPVLLVGFENGTHESWREFQIAASLFALVPLHCRRRLTFSTYEHEPQSLGAGIRPDLPSSPHRNRRLMMTTSANEFKLPTMAAGSRVWAVHHSLGETLLPPLSDWARWFDEKCEDGHQVIRTFCESASCFDFSDEWRGLYDASDLLKLPNTTEFISRDYELFAGAAGCIHRDYPPLLDLGHRLIAAWKPGAEGDRLLMRLVEGYLRSIEYYYAAPDEKRLQQRSQVVHDLGTLFRVALDLEAHGAIEAMLKTISRAPVAESICEECLVMFGQAIRETIKPDRVVAFAELWGPIQKGCRDAKERCKPFLTQSADHFCDLLRCADLGTRTRFAQSIESVLFPTLVEVPADQWDQLEWRLDLLVDLSAKSGMIYAGRLIATMHGEGKLKPEVLATIANERTDLLLRYYDAWNEAVNQDPGLADALYPAWSAEVIVSAYWRMAQEWDRRLHRQFGAALQQFKRVPTICKRLSSLYLTGGSVRLKEALSRRSWPQSLGELEDLCVAQCQLIDLVAENMVSTDPSMGNALAEHLNQLLAYILLCPLPESERDTDGKVLQKPFSILVRFSRGKMRTKMLRDIVRRIFDLRQSHGMGDTEPLPMFEGLESALRHVRLESDEVVWFLLWLSKATRSQTGRWEDHLIEVFAELLKSVPAIIRIPHPGSFRDTVADLLRSEEVWARLGQRLVADCTSREKIAEWLGESGERKPLLDELNRRNLLATIGETIASQSNAADDTAIERLNTMVVLACHEEIKAPARRQLCLLLKDRVSALVDTAYAERDLIATEDLVTSSTQTAIQLCQPLQQTIGVLSEDLLRHFWEYLGRQLAGMSPNSIRQVFPEIFGLGVELGSSVYSGQGVVWIDLFAPVFQARGPEGFASCFVAAGESLFSNDNGTMRRRPEAKQLAEFCLAEQVDRWFRTRPPSDIEAPRRTRFLGLPRTTAPPRRDSGFLFKALRRPLESTTDQRWVEDSGVIGTVCARAQFAALLYAPHSMESLAHVYASLGSSNQTRARKRNRPGLGCLPHEGW